MRNICAVLPGVLIGAAACAGGESAGARDVVRRDSAGIRIVESPAPLALRTLTWTLDSVPDLTIGTLDGEEPYQLFRVTGAVQLRDGRVAIVNAGTQQIRFFDSSGVFIRSAGGQGDGPGEYRFPELIRTVSQDTIWILDRGRVLSLLDPEGSLLATIAPRTPISQPVGILAGRLAGSQGSARASPGTPEGMMPNDITYSLIDLATFTQDTIAHVRGFDLFLWNVGNLFGFTQVPFDIGPSAAVGADHLYIASGDVPEVMVFDAAGTLRALFRVLLPPDPVSQADFDRVVEERVARASDEAEARRWYSRMPRPAVKPAFQNLRIDAAGNLWLEAFRSVANQRSEWVVLDSTGVALGRIATPPRVTIEHIGLDYILGIMRDENDVERVVRYGMRRS